MKIIGRGNSEPSNVVEPCGGTSCHPEPGDRKPKKPGRKPGKTKPGRKNKPGRLPVRPGKKRGKKKKDIKHRKRGKKKKDNNHKISDRLNLQHRNLRG